MNEVEFITDLKGKSNFDKLVKDKEKLMETAGRASATDLDKVWRCADLYHYMTALKKLFVEIKDRHIKPHKQIVSNAEKLINRHYKDLDREQCILKVAMRRQLMKEKVAEVPGNTFTQRTANGSTTTVKKTKRWEVGSPDQIPREYLMINADLIDKAIKDGKGVPGIKTIDDIDITIR